LKNNARKSFDQISVKPKWIAGAHSPKKGGRAKTNMHADVVPPPEKTAKGVAAVPKSKSRKSNRMAESTRGLSHIKKNRRKKFGSVGSFKKVKKQAHAKKVVTEVGEKA